MEFELTPIILTLRLASLTSVVLFVVCLPVAYWLSITKLVVKPAIEAIIALPIVLPPTVIGFYLLIIFGQTSFIGRFLADTLNISFVFSFSGLVVGSVAYSLPFMLQPLQSGFETVPKEYFEAARIAGASTIQVIWRVLLPSMRPSIMTGFVLSFAHTMGEFGVIMMIGGNIPGETRVTSLAVYDAVQSLRYQDAHWYSLVLLSLSFCILLLVYFTNRRFFR